MRVGLSWDLDHAAGASKSWSTVLAEVEQADALGYDSVWFDEARDHAASCSAPALFLTHVAARTQNVQLRVASRGVPRGDASPVRVAEEISVLDIFSRGRAGVSFASASRQGVDSGHVHETIEFVHTAWGADDFRYRGEHIRFPTHTPDDAPRGASYPQSEAAYVPQWERGPAMPDYLAITPKPMTTRPPLSVDIEDDATLDWAAKSGIAPFVGADVPTQEAVERLTRYRALADTAGRSRNEVDAVLERRIALDGEGDDTTLGGGGNALVTQIGRIRSQTAFSHLVWKRDGSVPGDLYRFAGEVQQLLQA